MMLKSRGFRSLAGLAVMLPILQGCGGKPWDAEGSLRRYQSETQTVTERNGYSVSTFICTPEYMAISKLRSSPGISARQVDSVAGMYASTLFISLELAPVEGEEPTQTGSSDALNAALAKGQSAFVRRLETFRSGMGRICYLELPTGEKVFPVNSMLDRGWGIRKDTRFLFAFPKEWNGKKIPILASHFVMGDIGMTLGTIRHQIKKPGTLKAKV
jgi:hypothetical protein